MISSKIENFLQSASVNCVDEFKFITNAGKY